jgi:hypothetical protein
MKPVLTLLSALTLAACAPAQTKTNPFVDPPKAAPKQDAPTTKKTNPFTNPDTKPTAPATKSKDTDKPDPNFIESKDPVVVPMVRLPSGHFLVKVKLNGTGPYNLVFDTGAPLMLLNSRIAKAGGVGKGGGGGLGLSLFGGLNPETVKALEVGSAKAANVPAVVMDHPTVAAISDAFEAEYGKIEGIVGFPFFARYGMTVDYQKGEMTLVPNGYKPGDYMKDLTSRLSALSGPQPTPVLAPAAAWGLAVEKKAKDLGPGVDVTAVLVGSPAAKAGVKVGDRLLTLDGRWTDSVADTFRATTTVKPGRPAAAELLRDGKPVNVTVTPVVGQ